MRLIAAALLAGVALAAPVQGVAQGGAPGTVPAGRVCTLRVPADGQTVREGNLINILDPFQVTCNDGANLRATSGTFDQVARVVTLDGDVYFEDATRSLTSEHAVYNNVSGMLHATGNVVFEDRVEGSTLSGPEIEYYRATEQRPEALVNAYQRPRLVTRRAALAPGEGEADASADTAEATPLTIDADRMAIRGENDLSAVGNVVIFDDDIRAVADQAEQRGATGTLELRGSAAIHSQEYSLSSDVIHATAPDGAIEEVEARGNARMLGESLNVDAPWLDLFFEEGLLQRSIARSDPAAAPGVQPIASSPTFRLVGDSIDASLPGQQLELVVAVGNARGESIDTTRAGRDTPAGATILDPMAMADSLVALQDSIPTVEPVDTAGLVGMPVDSVAAPDGPASEAALRLVENDWMTGDTITGYFASVVVPRDSMEAPAGTEANDLPPIGFEAPGGAANDTTLTLQRLVAVGAARSLYHVAPEEDDPPGTLPGINFLSAAHIELQFEDGQVSVATVEGLRRGLYLEPLPPEEQEDGEEAVEEELEAEDEGDAADPDVEPNEEDEA